MRTPACIRGLADRSARAVLLRCSVGHPSVDRTCNRFPIQKPMPLHCLDLRLPDRPTAWVLLLILSAMVAGCAGPRSAPTQAPAPAATPESSRTVKVNGHEQRVIEATNAFRASRGLPALTPAVALIRIAQGHARNMARQDRYGDSDRNGHVLDGRDMAYRIRAGGYAFARVAENVGYQLNRPDPVASMMQGWRESSGHRRNMLLDDITQFGVGAAQGRSGRWYFVQLFGRPAAPPRPVRTSQ